MQGLLLAFLGVSDTITVLSLQKTGMEQIFDKGRAAIRETNFFGMNSLLFLLEILILHANDFNDYLY